MSKTLYDILEVSQSASADVIKSAYRSLVAKYHPDKRATSDEDLFKKLVRAYEILSNPDTRSQYDDRILHGEEDLFLGIADTEAENNLKTVKRRDGSDTWCTIDEHIRRKGAELFNTNLKGLCLRNVSLSGAPLGNVDLSDANLQDVCLSRADLRGAVCRNGIFDNVDFSGAIFADSSMEHCIFKNCVFDDCTSSKSSFAASDFRGSSFMNTTLEYVDFSNCILEAVVFNRDRISHTDTENRANYSIRLCRFYRANLRGSNFGYHTETTKKKVIREYYPVSFYKTDFTGANLEEVKCVRSVFDQCNFESACLTSAYMQITTIDSPISFSNASLYGTNLTQSALLNIDFSTCNLVNTRIHDTVLVNVIFPEDFVPPASARIRARTESDQTSLLPALEQGIKKLVCLFPDYVIIGGVIVLVFLLFSLLFLNP